MNNTLKWLALSREKLFYYEITHKQTSFIKLYMKITKLFKLIRSALDKFLVSGSVLYHMRILYHTRMVHTVRVWYVPYAYGTILYTIRVWYVPYAYNDILRADSIAIRNKAI